MFNTVPFNPFPPSTEQKGANAYELPIAGAETLGGVKVGTGLSINSETGVLSASGYELPIAGAETLGGVKVGTGLSINSETGVLSATSQKWDYSTSEVNTGQKWVDGKDIYTKTVNCGTLPNNNTKVVGAEITAETVIKMEAFGIDANSTLPIPRIATGSNGIDIYYTYSSNSIVLTTFKDMTTHTAYITLFYTKIESED